MAVRPHTTVVLSQSPGRRRRGRVARLHHGSGSQPQAERQERVDPRDRGLYVARESRGTPNRQQTARDRPIQGGGGGLSQWHRAQADLCQRKPTAGLQGCTLCPCPPVQAHAQSHQTPAQHRRKADARGGPQDDCAQPIRCKKPCPTEGRWKAWAVCCETRMRGF